jgi:hypothetical protein
VLQVCWLKALQPSSAARRPGGRDTTVYGQSRASTTSFFGHHVATISSTIVASDALTLAGTAAAALLGSCS